MNEIEKKVFARLLSDSTGIKFPDILKYSAKNNFRNIIEQPDLLAKTEPQKVRVNCLKELLGIYSTITQSIHRIALNTHVDVENYIRNYFNPIKDKGSLIALLIDGKRNLIATQVVADGIINQLPVYSNKIAKEALFYEAKLAVLAHNFPEGSLIPKIRDIVEVKQLRENLRSFNVELLDHVTLNHNGYYSMVINEGLTSGAMPSEEEAKNSMMKRTDCNERLIHACIRGNPDLVELFLKDGADPNILNGEALKVSLGNQKVSNLLFKYGANIKYVKEVKMDDKANDDYFER